MDSHANFQTSAPRRKLRPMAGFRVMARRRDHSLALVTLAESRSHAAARAKAFCDALDAAGSRDGIVAVRIEAWEGTLTEGEWKPVSPWYDGFARRCAHHVRGLTAGSGNEPQRSLPRTGDKVECVLLGEKTRKGGWKAKCAVGGMEGPITNSADLPPTAQAGQTVVLHVGAIGQDGKRIQFCWRPADNTASP